jgi:hypothetical protein
MGVRKNKTALEKRPFSALQTNRASRSLPLTITPKLASSTAKNVVRQRQLEKLLPLSAGNRKTNAAIVQPESIVLPGFFGQLPPLALMHLTRTADLPNDTTR